MSQVQVRPPEAFADLLRRPLFAAFATVAPDCSPRVNPMWFYWDDDAGVLKMTHTNRRHNFRNLQKNARVALSVTDPDNQYRYIQVRGEVVKVDPDPTGAFYQTLQQRYRGYTTDVPDRAARVVLTIRPTAFKVRE
jgi:PPOX class probable F420-dependent enzyme